MRIHLLSCCIFILLFLSSPCLLYCATQDPASDTLEALHLEIRISFDLESARMQAEGRLVLPPERVLKLSFAEPENVRIAIEETEPETSEENPILREIVPNSDKTLILASAAHKRTLILSWQLTAPPPGRSGNLISPQGITLTGFWHPTASEKMLFSLTAEIPPGFSAVTEADEIEIIPEEKHQLLRLL